ncbi:MAG TPA: hypothetical protein VK961_24565 [Chthoniobacter sp.]|nr:hypothetical protein [Chthoniobacter sp.]
MKRHNLLEEKLDSGRIPELPLNEKTNPRIKIAGAVHPQIWINVVLRPDVCLA